MEKVTLEVADKATVQVESIGGDLRISGRKGSNFEAQAPDDGELNVEQDGESISVSARSGVLMYLPSATVVEIVSVGGDARITGLTELIMLERVGGDLILRRVGPSKIGLVGGDFSGRKLGGDLSLDQVGGDVVIEKVDGKVCVKAVGGDLLLRSAQGEVDVTAGGDASVEIIPESGKHMVVVVGGDLSCRLPEDASAKVQIHAGGDLMLPVGGEMEESDGKKVVRLGEGEGDVDLTAGGDLWLYVGERDVHYADEWLGDIVHQIEANAAEVEARVAAMMEGAFAFDAERIGERVRRSVSRARRKADKARRRAASGPSMRDPRGHTAFGVFSMGTSEVSEEERMTILRMLEEGKISVEDAEKLLSALEDEA